jgi:sulfur-carrier protein adenylyltransferase/sulfurtransferase
MPDVSSALPSAATAFGAALLKVQALLSGLGGTPMPLSADELAAYPKRGFVVGWRLRVPFSDRARQLDLLLPVGFPWEPPRVGLLDRPPFLTWPHLEGDGLLCLAPNTLTIDPDDPAGVVAVTLECARELIEELLKGEFDFEFAAEFHTYWTLDAHPRCPGLISLIRPEPPTRQIWGWWGKNAYVLGETPEQIEQWIVNRFGSRPKGFQTHEAAFLWIGTPPVPRDYPQSGQDVRALAGRTGGDELFAHITRACPDKVVTLLGVETPSGPALGAVVVAAPSPPQRGGSRDPLVAGFRPGSVPDSIRVARYFGGGTLRRGTIERADAAWIHGRGHDARFPCLRESRIVILGCGSVGAPIALSLAQAGVGCSDLVDPESMTWANAGRQPLGAAGVGENKAKGLAQKIRAEFPHAVVTPYDIDVDTIIRKYADVLASCDLIIAATGNWAADGRLEAWRNEVAPSVPVMHTWTEAHACAGHTVVLGAAGGCFRCGFDNTGVPALQITAWPGRSPNRTEPACGAVYQPYGPVELGFINSLAAELALDALLTPDVASTHRIWIGPAHRLRRLGGAWNEAWQRDVMFRAEGGFMIERSWPVASCSRCKKALAA